MAFDFPNSPTLGQVYEPLTGVNYTWNGFAWDVVISTGGSGGGSTDPVDWTEITGKPSTFPPTLPIAQSGITNLIADQTTQNTAIGEKLPKAGGTMTGPLILAADPTAALGAVTKQYVDSLPGAYVQFEYMFDTGTAEPVTSANVRFDSATMASVTKIWVHDVSSLGKDNSNIFPLASVGTKFFIQDKDEATKFQTFVISGSVIDKGSYSEFPVTFLNGGAALSAQRVFFVITGGGSGGSGGGGPVTWADIIGKPSTFPPTVPIAQADITNLVTDLAGKAPTSHTHSYSSLTSIPSTFAPSTHSHPQSEVTNLVTDLAAKAPTVHTHSYASLTGIPSTFAPSTHSHPTSEVTGLDTALTGKAATVHTHAQSDVTSLVTDLGLKAPLANPVFTGDPQAPTPLLTDNDTSIATTAFVQGVVDTATGAGLFGFFDYTFNSTNYAAPPISGNFRMNNATQTAVTHIFIHEQTAVSNDAALMLGQIAVGDKFLIQTKNDATKWQRYNITAIADMGTYWDFTVTWLNGGGTALTSARTAILVQKAATIGEAPNDALLYARKSLNWAAIPKITVATSAPSSPATNDIWIDTT